LYDPTYKRGKAKKFSYQYKGPYEVEQKISPLISKIRLADGTFTIVHVNRLKRAYEKETDSLLKHSGQVTHLVKLKRPLFKQNDGCSETPEIDLEVPPYMQVTEDVNDSLSEVDNEETSSLSSGSDDESDWAPELSYLQRKLQNDKAADDVAYSLRSRLVSRSGQEPEPDKKETEKSTKSGDRTIQAEEKLTTNHSYNLRDRKQAAPTST
jgi:hypothetical protein